MKNIPEEIRSRLEFEERDELVYVKRIRPANPCECGESLEDTRVVKINQTDFPFPHIREYCYTCRKHRHSGGEWYSGTRDLNQAMRAISYPKKPTL